MIKKIKNVLFLTITALSCLSLFSADFPSAKQTFQQLNQDPNNPLVLSFGVSVSQIKESNNTCNVRSIAQKLYKIACKQSNPASWLTHPDRIEYFLSSLPKIHCQTCQKDIDPSKLDPIKDKCIIDALAANATDYRCFQSLTLSKCPICHNSNIAQTTAQQTQQWNNQRDVLIKQIEYLNVHKQPGCLQGLPNYRISIELCDILKDNSIEIDTKKLEDLSRWLHSMGNPLLFVHHYANPDTKPHLFQNEEDSNWFAHCCAEIVKHNPQITHVCPISQPIAFCMRVKRATLPPFDYEISQAEFIKNIVQAHVKSYDAIKAINPNVQVLACHQYKPFLPKHNAIMPQYYMEHMVCQIADTMFNQAFIKAFKQYQDKFDGLALSVYPPIYFNLWKPEGSNISGTIDAQNSLKCITKMHEAFPDKKIIVAETGCNHPDENVQKKHLDMLLSIALQARKLGIDLSGIYLWGHFDEGYSEWNTKPNSSHFGLFKSLDNVDDIKPLGQYVKDIINQK